MNTAFILLIPNIPIKFLVYRESLRVRTMASLTIDGDAYTMYYPDQSPVAANMFAQVESEQTRMLQILNLPSTIASTLNTKV